MGFCFVCCFALLLCLLSIGPDKTSDCVMVCTPLSTPQRGTLNMHINNSFTSTTMCDDLARATEAQDGKKRTGEVHFCAPAFSYVLRSKKGSILCYIVLLEFP